MKLLELLEDDARDLVIIYPGRFHPFHIGHSKVYKYLKQKYSNAKVFISTSGKTDNEKSPFTFDEKRKMMMLAGVDSSAIVQCRSPYQSIEITEMFDPDKTVVVFAISEKDMENEPRFDFSTGVKLKKNGEAAHMQKWEGMESADTVRMHSYIATTPTFPFTIRGEKINSASQIRNMISKSDDTELSQILQDLYNVADIPQDVLEIFKRKIGNSTMNENWSEDLTSAFLIEDNTMATSILQALTESEYSGKQIKMAFGILNDPRYKDGNYDGAHAAIEKLAKGLASHPSVANAMKRANEGVMSTIGQGIDDLAVGTGRLAKKGAKKAAVGTGRLAKKGAKKAYKKLSKLGNKNTTTSFDGDGKSSTTTTYNEGTVDRLKSVAADIKDYVDDHKKHFDAYPMDVVVDDKTYDYDEYWSILDKVYPNLLDEGKSPHKKGTKKYNDHMAAMHAESLQEFAFLLPFLGAAGGMAARAVGSMIARKAVSAVGKKVANKWKNRSSATSSSTSIPSNFDAEQSISKIKNINASVDTSSEMQDEYKSNEDRNAHSRNIYMLAKVFGTSEEVGEIEKLLKVITKQGYKTPAQSKVMYDMIHTPYYSKLFPEDANESEVKEWITKAENALGREITNEEKAELNEYFFIPAVVSAAAATAARIPPSAYAGAATAIGTAASKAHKWIKNKIKKARESVTEGTWSIPDTSEKVKELKDLMKQELPADEAQDKMYGILGDDELFDDIAEMAEKDPKADVRGMIVRRLDDLGLLKNKKVDEGYSILPRMDRDKYQERDGLEGPIMTKSGKVVYYDVKVGSYYDSDTDIYLSHDEWKALDEAVDHYSGIATEIAIEEGADRDSTEYKAGAFAAKHKKKYESNPHKPGRDRLNWSMGHNEYRAKQLRKAGKPNYGARGQFE